MFTGPIRPQEFHGVNWDSPQAQGLVYWWPLYFDGDYTSRIYGDRAEDFVGVGARSYVSEFGRSVQGPADGTSFTKIDSTRITAVPLTMCGWTRPSLSGAGERVLSIGQGENQNNVFDFYTVSGRVGVVARAGAPFEEASISGVVNGEWQHVGATFATNASRRAWLNGRPGVEGTLSVTPLGLTRIGLGVLYRQFPTGVHLGGFADLRIYNRALTEPEMRALYDPQTRWDLYWQPTRRVYSLPPIAAPFHPAWARGSNAIIGAGG